MQPINLIAAALITQVSLLVVAATAGFLLHRYDISSPQAAAYRWTGLGWRMLGAVILTLSILMVSNAFADLWGPIFGIAFDRLLPWSTAIAAVFIIDILGVGYLVFISGGARRSPFAPIFFILPPLALFLREPGSHILTYFVLICLTFSVSMRSPVFPIGMRSHAREVEQREIEGLPDSAFWFVALASFTLATVVGYITRTAP